MKVKELKELLEVLCEKGMENEQIIVDTTEPESWDVTNAVYCPKERAVIILSDDC